jgi:hypothetical protein
LAIAIVIGARPPSVICAKRSGTWSTSFRFRRATSYQRFTLYRYMAAAGGLISYVDNTDFWRRSSIYVDRILKGAKPGGPSVQLPTKFELAVNLKSAKTLGLALPQTL